ncbi:hypothetical protein L5515_002129 [Caenorhabditis briggsae]|uniref:C2H2-type domain-containing protein n=1 Tax=Caenorhabditis briggsae TaxID=6238 RepID=A0AAE9E5P2_CAEBR|nr:hypothetical protein L5515_002129 [Caenorhabditis briggsae]
MDYDPSQQYRERHNASWDRIRHENASSVRSEPADPSYQYNSFDDHFDFQPTYQEQVVVNNNNYNAQQVQQQQLLDLDYIPIDPNQEIIDHNVQIHPNQSYQSVQPIEQVVQYETVPEFEEESVEEEDLTDSSESSDSDSDDEIDRPDIYCMDCHSKIEDTNRHDLDTCQRSKPPKFQCSLCDLEFNFEKNLRVHKILEHSDSTSFESGTACLFCKTDPKQTNPTKFSRFSAYIGHLKIHVNADHLACAECGLEFDNERERNLHIRRDHSEEVYELSFCPKCQKVIPLEETVAHSLLHSSENKVKTRQRNKRNTKASQKSAPPSAKNTKNLLSKLQTKSSPAGKKRKPAVRERKFKCDECEKAFVRPAELARHTMIHIRNYAAQIPVTPETPAVPKWKCAICFKEYAHRTGLAEHSKNVHGNPKQYICQVCGTSFTKKSNHDRHMLSIHPLDQDPKDQNKYQCPDCPTVFNTKGSLTRHKRSAHNNTSYLRPGMIAPICERHICKACRREYTSKKSLEIHMRTHLASEYRWRDLQGGGERKCDFCEKSFVLRASLIWHMQKHYEEQENEEDGDSDQQPYCALCDLNFPNPQELRQHQDEQHSVICGVCHQKFSSRQVYEDHICNRRFSKNQMLPSNRVVICRQCRPPQRLTTARQIKEHRAQHLPRKTHLCWTCHKSFRTAQLLSMHAEEVHDRQPVQCAHCPQVFHSRVALKQHTRTCHGGDTNYQCVVHVDRSMAMSAQSFAEYGIAGEHLDEHANRAHSVTEWMDPEEENEQEMQYAPMVPAVSNQNSNHQGRGTVVGDSPIRCEVCHHLYDNLDLLCEHWHGSEMDSDHAYRIVNCPLCDNRSTGTAEAANHLRNAHLFSRPRILPIQAQPSSDSLALALVPTANTIQQPVATKKGHQCTVCSKILTRKNDLDRHMKIHTGKKDFICPECGKGFRLKCTLKNHMATHSDEPPQIQCTVCQKEFFEKKTLVIHMRIHTGEQPFKCRFCDLHFRTTSMQKTHEKKCAYGGPNRPILPDPSARATSSFQPQFDVPQDDVNRTITQISTLPDQQLRLSKNSAFAVIDEMDQVATSGDSSIYIITKPITPLQYVVIVQKARPQEGTVRDTVDTVSEVRIHQLQESTNLTIVLHGDMRLSLNTVKMLEMIPAIRHDDVYKYRVAVGEDFQYMDIDQLFAIFAHNKTTSGVSSFIRRCEICEVDLLTKRASDAHFYSEDHETAQLMSRNQIPAVSVDRNLGMPNMAAAPGPSDLNCKLCGSRFLDMNSLLNHIRSEHDEPPVIMPPRPVAHTAPIN